MGNCVTKQDSDKSKGKEIIPDALIQSSPQQSNKKSKQDLVEPKVKEIVPEALIQSIRQQSIEKSKQDLVEPKVEEIIPDALIYSFTQQTNANILNADMCDHLFRKYLKVCGVKKGKDDPRFDQEVRNLILNAQMMFIENEMIKDFSAEHDRQLALEEQNANKPIDKKAMAQKKKMILDTFINANHPWFIKQADGTLVPINTMDCIRIFNKLRELKDDPDADPTLMTLLHLAKINLKDMTVIMDNKPDQILSLVKGENYERPRGENNFKADASNCNLKGKWPTDVGEYAKLWSKIEKGGNEGDSIFEMIHPTMREVVIGLYLFHMEVVEQTFIEMKTRHPERMGLYRENMRKAFNTLLFTLDLGDEDVDKPLTREIYENPNSPQVKLILRLYSMEPPFYSELNNASRDLDVTKLKTLGPFAAAIFGVLCYGDDSDKQRDDGLERGSTFKDTDPLGVMCRSFLLFRGALMNLEWIEDWRMEVGKERKLHGCSSTSKNLDVALGFSQCDTKYPDTKQAVLYVISIKNFNGFQGFRLSDNRYSVYPGEQEYLLCEGFGVHVLGIQDGFMISNKHLPQYDDKKITIIFLQSVA